MARVLDPTDVRVGPRGRVVIPAPLRRSLGISEGDTLSARSEDGRLVLEKPEAIVARIQRRFAAIPEGVSLVDELIVERRAEGQREDLA